METNKHGSRANVAESDKTHTHTSAMNRIIDHPRIGKAFIISSLVESVQYFTWSLRPVNGSRTP